MKKALSFVSRHQHLFLMAGCMVLAVMFAFVPELAAQNDIVNTGQAKGAIQRNVAPVVEFARLLLAFGAVILGIFEAFKAAKGSGGKDWIKVITLFIVAALLLSPATFLGLLGLSRLCTELAGFGIC